MRAIELYINASDGVCYLVGSTDEKNLWDALDYYRSVHGLTRKHMFVVVL